MMKNNIFGYNFKNKKLLERALTHCSFSKENYERLEFLGDSILDFVVGEYFFLKTQETEGNLTKLRASFVSETYLCNIFDKLKLDNDVIFGKSYKGNISNSIKADVVESIIGAILLDSDFQTVKQFVIKLLNLENYQNLRYDDYKSQLQEFLQKEGKFVTYKLLSQTGQNHNPTFEMGVYVDDKLIDKAKSSSKQKAENICAKKALEKLKIN